MKTLRDYVAETETWITEPAVGDSFAINIREECLIESYIVDTRADGVVIHADQRMMQLLEGYGYLMDAEDARDAVRNAVVRRIVLQHSDLLTRYGVEAVMSAVDDIADDLADVEEIGSSDVSAYVGMVKDQLGDRMGSREEMLDRRPFAEEQPDTVHAGSSQRSDDPYLLRMMDLAGVPRRVKEGDISQLEKDIADAPVKPIAAMEADDEDDITDDLDAEAMDDENLDEGVMSEIDMDLRHIAKTQRVDALVDGLRGDFGANTAQYLQNMMSEIQQQLMSRGQQDVVRDQDRMLAIMMDRIADMYDDQDLDEAEYQGRKVPLGKPMKGDVKKSKVYVKGPKGNVVKVNFGDPNMKIKKSNPKRRKSFRARHNCDNPGPRWKARYWSCRAW